MGTKRSVGERLRGHLKRGRRLWRAKDNEGAKRAFTTGKRAARRARQEGDAKLFQGLIRLVEADADGALEHLNMALEASTLVLRGTAYHYLGYAHDEKGEYDQAIECYKKALVEETYDTPGYACNNMGLAYYNKGDYDQAIECYKKALVEETYDTPGYAWNNMGLAYRRKGDYDQAIECHEKALAEETYDTPGYPWNNMGLAYDNKGDYDQAIQCYEKAVAEESYDTPGNAWHNMGIAYGNKGDYDRAIQCYEKALAQETYDTPGLAWKNMGELYEEIGEYQEAVKCYEKAVEALRKAGEDGRAELTQMRLEVAKRTRDDRARLADEAVREVLETLPPYVAGLRAEAEVDRREELVRKWLRQASLFEEYAEKPSSGRDNVFAVLKGWSSSIPFLSPDVTGEFEANPCKGGGYFIRWGGKGLVIDPGINFVDNFHREGFHIREIDAVLTTHEHVDHCFDLEQIHDLVHQYNKQILTTSSNGEPVGEPHRLLYCLDQGSKRQHEDALTPRLNADVEPPVELRAEFFPGEEVTRRIGMKITPFKVSHSRAFKPVGLIVECLDKDSKPIFRFGFTSDAEYKKDLAGHLKGCNVVVMHLGTTHIKDIMGQEMPPHHLGCCGTTKLVQGLDSPLFLIAEFWAGRGDLRLDLTKAIEHEVGGKKLILPVDIGFVMEIPSGEVRCSSCGEYRVATSIITVPPARPFGTLRYLCPRCVT